MNQGTSTFITMNLVFFMLGVALVIPILGKEEEIFAIEVPLTPLGDDPFQNSANLGYELLDNNTILHMWNQYNSYYFNISNGIQFSNHYLEYWTRNILMLGYYDGDAWNLIYRTDELSGFNKNITGETDDYINATLWKDLSYGSYDFRLALRYHLDANDSDLTIVPYIKNLGIAIPFDIGFGWEMKDIKIDNTYENDQIRINGTSYLLNQTLDIKYTNITRTVYEYNETTNITTNYTVKNGVFYLENLRNGRVNKDLYLKWHPELDYLVLVKSRGGQYNAPVTLFIKVGTLNVGQEKSTELHWLDADIVDSYSETNYDADSNQKDEHPSDSAYSSARGQSFTCTDSAKITEVKFYLKKVATPSGNAYVKLYAHSGTYGTSSQPGATLATSDAFDVSTLTTSYQLISFTFTGAQQYTMEDSTYYVVAYENPEEHVTSDWYVKVGVDSTSSTHDGNPVYFADGSWGIYTMDTCFYVYGEIVAPPARSWQSIEDWLSKYNLWNGSIYNDTKFLEVESWNGSIYNVTQDWLSVESWNGSIYNITIFDSVEIWNGSIFNDTKFLSVETWNGSIFNSTAWDSIETWNGSIFNDTSFNSIESWNGSIFNETAWDDIESWNGSICNITQNWISIDIWNGSIFNISIVGWDSKEIWNGSIFNITNFQSVESWNGSIFNDTNYQSVESWNGSIFNVTIRWDSKEMWNGSIFNITGIEWTSIESWNGSICNTTPALITFSNIYPEDGAVDINPSIDGVICATIANSLGNNMTIVFWYSTNGTDYFKFEEYYNASNGTYCFVHCMRYNQKYYWYVNATDITTGYSVISDIFSFTTAEERGWALNFAQFQLIIYLILAFAFICIAEWKKNEIYIGIAALFILFTGLLFSPYLGNTLSTFLIVLACYLFFRVAIFAINRYTVGSEK